MKEMFQLFRQMCNDAIRIAVATNPLSRYDLISSAYENLKGYGLHSHYIQNVCGVAFAAFQRWKKDAPQEILDILTLPHFKRQGVLSHLARLRIEVPLVRMPFLRLDNQTYKLDYLLLRIPTRPRVFEYIVLDGSMYHRAFLADLGLKRGSIVITESSVVIAFSRKVETIEPAGQMGLDVNERNVTWSDTAGKTARVDTSQVVEIKERYKAIRAKIAGLVSGDRRTMRRLLSKYGRREKNRTSQLINRVSKEIVEHAKQNKLEIKMERLTGIRRLYRKGNHQGTSFRGRMNSWTFREIQRQVEYKATWEGIPVAYVSPRGTSQICLCGSRVATLAERKLYCPGCDRIWDRDELASKNVMAAPLVRAARPSKRGDEGGTR
ncbi:MAG: transposase [Thaumarchaeota archaeon]|nr:transposase [Nitrososphaerota archaeon]